MIDVRALAQRLLRDAGLDDRQVRLVHLNRSGPQGDFAVLIVFSEGSEIPKLLIKLTQDPSKAALLRQEFRNLTLLHEHGSEALRRSIPRPMSLEDVEGVAVLVESAVPGRRMKNFPPQRYFATRRFRRHLDEIVTFLGELHRCDGVESLPPALTIDEAVARYRAGFDVSAELDRLLDETADRLRDRPAPGSPLHGDFCTANILVDDDAPIVVIDWEFPLRREWPLADLLHFLASVWCIPYRKGRQAAAERYRTMFFGDHPLRDLIRGCTFRHLRDLGLRVEDVLPLSVASWLLYANRKREALSAAPHLAERAEEQWPLVLIDGRRCSNLELLATQRGSYVLGGASENQPGSP